MPFEPEHIAKGNQAARLLGDLIRVQQDDDFSTSMGYFDPVAGVIIIVLLDESHFERLMAYLSEDGSYRGFKVYVSVDVPVNPKDDALMQFIRKYMSMGS